MNQLMKAFVKTNTSNYIIFQLQACDFKLGTDQKRNLSRDSIKRFAFVFMNVLTIQNIP